MFRGQYEAVIDGRGRVTVPGRYRKEISGGLTITDFAIDETRCLNVSPTFNADCHLDKSARLKIPRRHRDYAGLKREIVIAGAGPFFRIFDREAWREVFRRAECALMNNPGLIENGDGIPKWP